MFDYFGSIFSAETAPWMIAVFIFIMIWSLIWKGLALWKSARKNSPAWFIILLLFNTVGILEILYIFLFSKMKFGKKVPMKKSKKKRR